MKMTTFLCLTATALLLAVPLYTKGETADSLFNEGKWREALLSYQDQVRDECQAKQLIPVNQNFLSSSIVETDLSDLLKAHCLFERGTLAYLKKNYESATQEWVACREALNASPNEGKPYLRRVNMALGQVWAHSLANKDLKYFHDGLSDICKTIDEEPLPENTPDFRSQFQQEFRFIFANSVLSSIPQLNPQNESISTGVIAQRIMELLAKKALFKLLADESRDTARSYEAQIDRILFADSTHEIALELDKKLFEAASLLRGPVYSDLVSMICCFRAESNFENVFSGFDPSILSSNRYRLGNTLYQITKIEAGFSVAYRDRLLQAIGKHLDIISWPTPETQLEMATAIARAGCAKEAQGLLNSFHDTKLGMPIYPRLCVVSAEVLYFTGDFKASLSVGSDLPSKEIPAELYYWRGLAYAKMQNSNEAIEALKTFISKSPAADEAPEACFLLGAICLSSGKKADALRYFQQTSISYSGSTYAARAEQFAKALSH